MIMVLKAAVLRVAPVLLCALAGAAGAGTNVELAQADQLMHMSLEQLLNVEVVAASKFSQSVDDAPASVTILSSDDIRSFGYRTLGDALSSVRGFYMTGDRIYNYAGVRGFSPPGDFNDRLLVMVDGYRTNENIFDSGFLGSAFPLDLDLVDRIEIIRGPGSSLYGGNALFGVINVITKNGADLGGAEASVALARDGNDRERLSWGKRLDNGGDLLFSASRQRAVGPSLQFQDIPANGGVTSGTDFDHNQSVFAKYSLEGFSLEAAWSRRDKGNPAAYTGTVFNDPASALRDEMAFVDARYRHTLDGDIRAEGRLFVGSYDYTGRYLYANAPLANSLNLDIASGRWWGGELKLLRDLGKHRLTAGVEFQQNWRQEQVNYDLGAAGSNVDEHHSSRRWGMYAQDDYRLTGDTSLSAGVRYDRATGADGNFSPRLATVTRLSPDTVLKLLYGSAYRMPNNYELYYTFPGQQAANPGLRPERIRTYEATLDHYLTKSFRLSLAAYLYRMKDQIAQVVEPTSGLLQYQNQGDISGRGLELGMESRFQNGARLRGSLGLLETEDALGRQLDNSPRQLAKLSLLWPWAESWRVGVEGQGITARTSAGARVPGNGRVNLTLLRPLRDDWEFSASAYNLFDRRVLDPASSDPGITASYGTDRTAIPADGLVWRLKLTRRF
ncbi:MAG: TonB-dependent receptor [Rhodocyclaceae bacterium]|nr:TonB-dependent receptor [Rhodocyclaceae bacterium]